MDNHELKGLQYEIHNAMKQFLEMVCLPTSNEVEYEDELSQANILAWRLDVAHNDKSYVEYLAWLDCCFPHCSMGAKANFYKGEDCEVFLQAKKHRWEDNLTTTNSWLDRSLLTHFYNAIATSQGLEDVSIQDLLDYTFKNFLHEVGEYIKQHHGNKIILSNEKHKILGDYTSNVFGSLAQHGYEMFDEFGIETDGKYDILCFSFKHDNNIPQGEEELKEILIDKGINFITGQMFEVNNIRFTIENFQIAYDRIDILPLEPNRNDFYDIRPY